ncbi:BTAD domain-containing putative transcriptional regulator [Nonomuraea sp. NPDC049152]|uniref:BTAD domain-containing putative transcriptional regulator n=1 Tax=Nonomuraea sp. NPDC049152 TaxID=3154350 RepID=UPI0033E490D4
MLLALEAGRPVSVDRLIDALWEDAPPANVGNALQTLVKRLRAGLGAGVVRTTSAGYVLALPQEAVDACRFTSMLASARQVDGDEERVALLGSALSLWRGKALAGFAHVPSLEAAATHLTELRLTAVQDWTALHLRLGRAAEIVNELAQLAAAHPLRESLCAVLLRVLAASGRRAEALEVFQRTRRLLAEELGVDPSQQLVEAHLEVLRADRAPVSNLRGQLTSFVGREDEIAGIAAMLRESRLVTLVGPGGAGKTRLAVESATRMAERWPDGTWLVELARVVDPGAVPYALLAALGIRDNVLDGDGARIEPAAQIAGVLGGKRLLLIVDNCEHVLDGAAALIDGVLARCPGVDVLAASREPLGITGEVLSRVPPLAVPEKGASAAETAASPAVRLFADRGRSVRPGFSVDDGNSAVVGAVCRRLDGVPLAIELAAARLRALTPEQIADRLDDRFRLLTGGNRAALPRHQTLRAVVDWSWNLLTEPEMDLAKRLSVFTGGATLDSAERVCGGDVLDALLSLVDKSLVETEDGRFRMLETIRAYCAEQLGADAEAAHAHALYFLRLAEEAVPKLRTAEQLTWIGRLAGEHDNCVAALGWAVGTGAVELALRLCGALTWYWQLRGYRAEASHWAGQVLALAGERPPPRLVGAYLACEYATRLPEFVGMVGFDEAADRPGQRARIRDLLETCEGEVHPIFTILASMDGSLDGLAADRDPWLANTALLMRGTLRMNNAQHGLAERDLQAAVAGFRQLGERRGLSRSLLTLATFRTRADGVSSAIDLMEEVAGLAAEWVSAGEAVSTLTRLAHLHAWDGDLVGTAAAVARAREQITIGVPAEVRAQLRLTEADLARRGGDSAAALPIYEEVLATLETSEQTVPLDAVWAHASYGMALADQGDVHRAYAQLGKALELTVAVPDVPVLIAVSVGYAVAALAEGDAEAAARLIEAGAYHHDHRGRGGPDVARIRALALSALGESRYAEIASPLPVGEIVAVLKAAGST